MTWRTSNGPRVFCYLLACTLMLWFAHEAAISIRSVHHDQYRYFHDNTGQPEVFKSSCANDFQNEWLSTIGRPGGALLECFVFRNSTSVRALLWLRLGVILELGLGATLLAICLRRAVSDIPAVLLSVAIFTLPGFQNAVFMTNYANATAPILGLVSFIVLNRNRPEAAGEIIFQPRSLVRILLAAVLLVCSFATYQTLAFFFFVPFAAVAILKSPSRTSLRRKMAIRSEEHTS